MTSTNEECVICVDNSGSVSGSVAYWKIVKQVVDNYIVPFHKVHYVLWNSSHTIGEEQYKYFLTRCTGTGGTSPSEIVKACSSLRISKNICIITDGEVSHYDVATCDQALKNQNYDNVECHIINNQPNLSVTCPFTRNNTAKVFTYIPKTQSTFDEKTMYVKETLVQIETTCVLNRHKDDYRIINEIESISWDTLVARFDTIKELLLTLNMGTNGNATLKDQLVRVKKRIIKEFSNRQSLHNTFTVDVRTHLANQDVESAVERATKFTKDYFVDDSLDEVNRKMDQLISLCGDLRQVFTKDAIASYKVARSDEVEDVELKQEENNDKYEFVCPVLMDNDCPCILIDEVLDGDQSLYQSVMVGLDKATTEFILECPLRLLSNETLVQKVKLSISQVVGLNGIEGYENRNPYTRNRMLGVLPLGQLENHVDVCNYVLAQLFTDGRKLGNSDMWFCVIYFIAKQLPFMEEHMPLLETHLKWRLSKSVTYASLSGLVTLVSTKVNTDVALWYILGSYAYQFSGASDLIRFHLPHIDPITKLVQLLFGENSIPTASYTYI